MAAQRGMDEIALILGRRLGLGRRFRRRTPAEEFAKQAHDWHTSVEAAADTLLNSLVNALLPASIASEPPYPTRRQLVPLGPSSSRTPSAASSSRMRSAVAKSFALRAARRSAMRASIAAASGPSVSPPLSQ